MRPLVSYDDIASQPPEHESVSSDYPVESGSPPKKRRKNNRQGQRHRNLYHDEDNENREHSTRPRQWDYGLKEESRQLTHEEVWDDSALIHAWDAAVEEYEVINGPDKKWKSEPVKKSTLWFNIPPEQEEPHASPGPSLHMPFIPAAFTAKNDEQDQRLEATDPENSRPVNFDTYVPHHNPALNQADDTETSPNPSVFPPAPPGVLGHLTKDETFQQVIGAWYWAGYWTGVYHSTSGTAAPDAAREADEHGYERETTKDVIDGDKHQQNEDVAAGGSIGEVPMEEQDLIPT